MRIAPSHKVELQLVLEISIMHLSLAIYKKVTIG